MAGRGSSSVRKSFRRYFGIGSVPTVDDVRADIWTPLTDLPHSSEEPKSDLFVLLEQYKLYVEMADRISARHMLANTFFLTLNSAIFTVIGVFWTNRPHAASWLLIFPVFVLIAQSMAWFWLVRSYRQLNAAKYTVVGAFEERLSASPFWRAEWKALGGGKDPSRYWPLSHVEQWIPVLFAISYISGFIALLVA